MPVRETTSFSNREASMPDASRQSMVSAPAGPSVVMTCITLIMLIFRLPLQLQECSSIPAYYSFFGRNGGTPKDAFYVRTLRMIKEPLV